MFSLLNKVCQKTLCSLKKCCLMSATLDNTRQKRSTSFFPMEKAFFRTKFVSTSWVLKKKTYSLNNICHKTLWTVISCSLRFFTLDNTKKNGPKILSPRKQIIIEMFVSIDLSGPIKHLINCLIIVKISRAPL